MNLLQEELSRLDGKDPLLRRDERVWADGKEGEGRWGGCRGPGGRLGGEEERRLRGRGRAEQGKRRAKLGEVTEEEGASLMVGEFDDQADTSSLRPPISTLTS